MKGSRWFIWRSMSSRSAGKDEETEGDEEEKS